MPPIRTEPVSLGCAGSVTSYCLSSPVAQHDDVEEPVVDRQVDVGDDRRDRAERLEQRRQQAGSAGSAGIVMTFSTAHVSPSRNQRQTEPERSSVLTTTPRKP